MGGIERLGIGGIETLGTGGIERLGTGPETVDVFAELSSCPQLFWASAYRSFLSGCFSTRFGWIARTNDGLLEVRGVFGPVNGDEAVQTAREAISVVADLWAGCQCFAR